MPPFSFSTSYCDEKDEFVAIQLYHFFQKRSINLWTGKEENEDESRTLLTSF